MPWSPDQSSGIFMIENVGHDIKTENTFEEYPIEESTFNNFYIDEQNDGKKHYILYKLYKACFMLYDSQYADCKHDNGLGLNYSKI